MQQAHDLYELVCGRYQRASMIAVSNRPRVTARCSLRCVGRGAFDRPVNSPRDVLMVGHSRRPVRRPLVSQPAGSADFAGGAPPHNPTSRLSDQPTEDHLDRRVLTAVQTG